MYTDPETAQNMDKKLPIPSFFIGPFYEGRLLHVDVLVLDDVVVMKLTASAQSGDRTIVFVKSRRTGGENVLDKLPPAW